MAFSLIRSAAFAPDPGQPALNSAPQASADDDRQGKHAGADPADARKEDKHLHGAGGGIMAITAMTHMPYRTNSDRT